MYSYSVLYSTQRPLLHTPRMAFLSPPVLKLMRASLHESHDAPSHPMRQGRSQTLRLVTRCSRVSFADVGTEPRDGQYAIPHHTMLPIVSPRSASSDSARELQLEQTIRAEADRRVRGRGRERDGTRHRGKYPGRGKYSGPYSYLYPSLIPILARRLAPPCTRPRRSQYLGHPELRMTNVGYAACSLLLVF